MCIWNRDRKQTEMFSMLNVEPCPSKKLEHPDIHVDTTLFRQTQYLKLYALDFLTWHMNTIYSSGVFKELEHFQIVIHS